jgi:hypothetical protein
LATGGGSTGQHGTSGRFGICRVALTPPAPVSPVGSVDLDDGDTFATQHPVERSSVGGAALHSGTQHGAELSGLEQHGLVTGCRRRKLPGAQQRANRADYCGDVDLLMRIDSLNHLFDRTRPGLWLSF